jgi:hypothetical protein
VQSPERQVTCDLKSDCGLMFNADVAEKLQSKGPPAVAEDDSAAENVSGLQLEVTTGSGGPLRLGGAFEYSTIACGEVACPFYLGRLDLEQTDSAWPLSVDLGALGRLDKSVSGLRVQLGEPTLGIALADGQVAFPAGSLLLRIDAQLAGTSDAFARERGRDLLAAQPDRRGGPARGRLARPQDGGLDRVRGGQGRDDPPLMAHGAQLPRRVHPTIIDAHAHHRSPRLARVRSLRGWRPR